MDHDLYITIQGGGEFHRAFNREALELIIPKRRNLWLVDLNLSRPEFSRELPPALTAILSLCVWPAAYANRGS